MEGGLEPAAEGCVRHLPGDEGELVAGVDGVSHTPFAQLRPPDLRPPKTPCLARYAKSWAAVTGLPFSGLP